MAAREWCARVTEAQLYDLAVKLNKKRWIVNDCAFCQYKCGFYFSANKRFVVFDMGCNCPNLRTDPVRKSSWKEILLHIREQTDGTVARQYMDFWTK